MRKKVLITVLTYPLPSRSYDELVCTAGILEDGSWIRIYPIRFKFLSQSKALGSFDHYKYSLIELDLNKRSDDFRPESHSPVNYDFSDLEVIKSIGTNNNWAARKEYCLKNVYYNKAKLIADSQKPKNLSLATFKPSEIIKFEIEEDDREWKQAWKDQFKQLSLNFGESENAAERSMIRKLPYKFYYRFKDDQGIESRLMIEDWEIGQLYWNCYKSANGDEKIALEKVRYRYWTEFVEGNKDIYLFLGTLMESHRRRYTNPFVIIGVFYPKKQAQLSMF